MPDEPKTPPEAAKDAPGPAGHAMGGVEPPAPPPPPPTEPKPEGKADETDEK